MNSTGFTLNNFFIFLIEFGFSILFLVLFSCIHYGITRSTKLGEKIEKSKMWNFWYFFIFGFILALLSFIVSSVSTIAIGDIGMPLTILGLIYAMTLFYNRSVQVGALLPTILWVLFEYNGFTTYSLEWLLRLAAVLVMSIVAFATTYIKWKPWPTTLLSSLATTVLLVGFLCCFINSDTGYYCAAVIVSMVIMLLYYAVIRFINKWLTQMSQLAKQGAYVDKHYLIPTVLDQYFNQFIDKRNVSQALVVSLTFTINNKNKDILLDKIYSLFHNDDCLFFKSSYETYGLILSGKQYNIINLNKSFLNNKNSERDVNDDLRFFETKLSKLLTLAPNLKAYVSVYGVHSCNLNQLLKNNHYALKHVDKDESKNIIQLFNTNITNQEISDNIAYATLSQKVNLNDIDVELELIKMNKTNKIFVCPRFYWPKMLTCDTKEIMQMFDVTTANTLLRSLAVKSLEKYINNVDYQQYKLLIYYPIDELNSSTWKCIDLIKKIKLYGLDPKQVILSFNCSKLKVWPRQIIQNLLSLEQYQQSYFLVDVVNLTAFKTLHPLHVIIDQSIAKQTKTKALIKKYKISVL